MINFYQIKNVNITMSPPFDSLSNHILSISVPQLSCSQGIYDMKIFELKYPSQYTLSGTIQQTLFDDENLRIYKLLKDNIGKRFTITLVINLNNVSEQLKKITNGGVITYKFINCVILNLPQVGYTLVDEPSNITYDVEIQYEKFTFDIS